MVSLSFSGDQKYKWFFYFAGFLLIFLIRIPFTSPIITNDSKLYMQLADNLVINQCYGNVLATGECVPSWGSAQPPGYPLFLAFVRIIIGTDSAFELYATQVVFFQTALFAIAAIITILAAYTWHKNYIALICSLIVIAISPLSVAWPRWVLTETLAASTGLLTFAALFYSLSNKHMKVLFTGLATAFAVFIRWDQIWLLLPVAFITFSIEGWCKGFKKFIKIAFITAIPIIVMISIAISLGLPPLPQSTMDTDPWLTEGVRSFYREASLTQEAASGFLWPLWSRNYYNIDENFNYKSIISSYNTESFQVLMKQISMLGDGNPFPDEIDAELIKLARESSIGEKITKTFQRTLRMWIDKDIVFFSGWLTMTSAKTVESFSRVYRIILLCTSILLLVRARGSDLFFLVGVLSYIILRTLFVSSLAMVEIRYLMPMFPIMEISLISLAFKRKSKILI